MTILLTTPAPLISITISITPPAPSPETAKLTGSDVGSGDYFGWSVALSGTSGLVGAVAGEALPGESTGAAYLYRGLDNATDTITQTAKLIASDGAIIDEFGYSVSLSGSTGLVGAYDDADPDHGADAGSAYVYRHLDTATGTMTESVKLTASAGETNDHFGASVSVDGDQFIVGSPSGKGIKPLSGIAYTGSVGSLTTLDAGNTAKVISRISFVSREDWIIGQTTDANHVTLSAGDTANITYAGKVVFIGQSTGSDANLLQIAGTLRATTVDIGSLAVNTGNTLQLDSTAAVSIATIHLAPGNRLVIAGDLTAPGALFTYLAAGGTQFKIYQNGIWVALDATNASTRIGTSFASGYTTITHPSPSSSTPEIPPRHRSPPRRRSSSTTGKTSPIRRRPSLRFEARRRSGNERDLPHRHQTREESERHGLVGHQGRAQARQKQDHHHRPRPGWRLRAREGHRHAEALAARQRTPAGLRACQSGVCRAALRSYSPFRFRAVQILHAHPVGMKCRMHTSFSPMRSARENISSNSQSSPKSGRPAARASAAHGRQRML